MFQKSSTAEASESIYMRERVNWCHNLFCYHQLVELLLKHGANPLQANSKGKTPLDVAASQEMVKILKREIISSGSDSSSIDDTRSPMSQDSINSMKDDERSLDMDGMKSRSVVS